MNKSIPITLLRGLMVKQKGKCAMSGLPLTSTNMAGDHIEPVYIMMQEGNNQIFVLLCLIVSFDV